MIEESPLLNPTPSYNILPEDIEWAEMEATTNKRFRKFYEYYKLNPTDVFTKLYKALLSRFNSIAESIASKKMSDEDMINFITKGDKIPKAIESYRLLSEGKSVKELGEAPVEFSMKDMIDYARNKSQDNIVT